jgi:hypothetical protein
MILLGLFLILVLIRRKRTKLKIELDLWLNPRRVAGDAAALHSTEYTTLSNALQYPKPRQNA